MKEKKTTIIILVILWSCACLSSSEATTSSSSNDYKIESTQDKLLNKKFVSLIHNISVNYPANWEITPTPIDDYSVVKIRSERGKGLENINITVIPLNNKKKHAIEDFENIRQSNSMELLDSGYTTIGSEKALWKTWHMETRKIWSNPKIKDMLKKPSFMYRESANNGFVYQIQIVWMNNLYTITAGALGSSKDEAKKNFEKNENLLMLIVNSFEFEKMKYTSQDDILSITIPDGWSRIKTQGGKLVKYGKPGSGENMLLISIPIQAGLKVQNLSWDQIFYPYQESIKIEKDGIISVSKAKAKFCVYILKHSKLKQQREGKYDLQYYCVTFIHLDKLYLITFADSRDNFNKNYQTFTNSVKSINLKTK